MIRYLKDYPESFDPDTIHILVGAMDDAWRVVQANKADLKIEDSVVAVRQVLAKHIVDIAIQGERDRQRLADGALARLGL